MPKLTINLPPKPKNEKEILKWANLFQNSIYNRLVELNRILSGPGSVGAPHTHVRSDITNLWNTPFWSLIPDKPDVFLPSPHNHAFVFDENYSTLDEALSVASNKTLVLSKIWQITSNKTLPENIAIFIVRGGGFNISSGITLSIYGAFWAGRYRVFWGDGDVEFGQTYWNQTTIYPEWWGALPRSGIDSTVAIQKAINAASGLNRRGNIVSFAPGSYGVSSTLYIYSHVTLRGDGGKKNSTMIYLIDNSNCDLLRNYDYGNTQGTTQEGIKIENIHFYGNKANQTATSHGLNFSGVNILELRDVYIEEFKGDGFRLIQNYPAATNLILLDNVDSYNNDGDGFHINTACRVHFRDCRAEKNGEHGFHYIDSGIEEYELGMNALTISCPYIEDNDQHGIYIERGANITITNPFFWGGQKVSSTDYFLKIGSSVKNVTIIEPMFWGIYGGSPPGPDYDIYIQNGAKNIRLIGGSNALRGNNFRPNIYDATNQLYHIRSFGNQARAYRSTNQSTTDGTWVQVQLNAESFDPGQNFDSSNNYCYLVPEDGYYSIMGQVSFGLVQAGRYLIAIQIDSTNVSQAEQQLSTVSNYVSLSINDLQYLARGQQVKLMAFQQTGTNTPVIYGGATRTFMAIFPLL